MRCVFLLSPAVLAARGAPLLGQGKMETNATYDRRLVPRLVDHQHVPPWSVKDKGVTDCIVLDARSGDECCPQPFLHPDRAHMHARIRLDDLNAPIDFTSSRPYYTPKRLKAP